MRAKTPYFGPHAGTLLIDGAPAKPLDTTEAAHPVALPDVFGSDPDPGRSARGRDRTAALLYEQYQRAGSDMTYTDAQARVIQAKENADRRSR